MPIPLSPRATILLLILLSGPIAGRGLGAPPGWQQQCDQLVTRLQALVAKENAFGPAYQPLYHAALPWYEQWGGRAPHVVDDWMVPPDDYARELADALEHGRNFFAENPEALLPLVFAARLPDGKVVNANYWTILPTGFPGDGRRFPLVISLHGSGWLGHPISYVRKTRHPVAARRAFGVTPIDEGGPWQIDFLNAYLDELLRILPVDRDHVYVEGHSLGAMATWEWALDNPERFAAISPRAGVGEPFRAVRLKNVPAWVIHGADDDVVPSGFSDQMVTALQSCGASARYSVLRGVPHNMPPDLDEEPIMDWYLRQTRSPAQPPADPRDALGVTLSGFSPWEIITVPARRCWRSDLLDVADDHALRQAAGTLFSRVHELGELVDAPLQQEMDLKTRTARLWLAVPTTLQPGARADSNTVAVPLTRYIRFYYRGTTADALLHLASVAAEAEGAGHSPRKGTAWITPLSLWRDTANYLAEYRLEIEP